MKPFQNYQAADFANGDTGEIVTFMPGRVVIALPEDDTDEFAKMIVAKMRVPVIPLDVAGNPEEYAAALAMAVEQFSKMGLPCVILDARDAFIELQPTTTDGEQVTFRRRLRVFQRMKHAGSA